MLPGTDNRPNHNDDDEQRRPLFGGGAESNQSQHNVYDSEFEKIAALSQEPSGDQKAESPAALEGQEQSGGTSEQTQISPAEEALRQKATESLYNARNTAPVGMSERMVSIAKTVAGKVTRRRAVIGSGLAVSLLSTLMLFIGFGSFEAIHVRENMLGNSNGIINQALQHRRGRSFARQMRQLSREALNNRVNTTRLADKLRSQGFVVGFDADGKVNQLDYGGRSFNFSDSVSDNEAARAFFGEGDLGREISQRFDKATNSRASIWRGRNARKVYNGVKVSLRNWLPSGPERNPEIDTTQERITQALREANRADQQEIARVNTAALADSDGDGRADVLNEGEVLADDTPSDRLNNIERFGDVNAITEGLQDPSNSVDSLLGVSSVEADALSGVNLGSPDAPVSPGQLVGQLSEATPRLAGRVDNIAATSVGTALNLAEVPRIGCRIKGTLNFIATLRSVSVASQLAAFSVRFLTAADHQKAGLVQSDGMAVLMNYLHTPNPLNGRSYTQAPGFQSIIMRNDVGSPSASNLARFSTGRNQPGVFGSILGFINAVPGLGQGTCRFVSNGFVQVAGGAIGIVAAIASGGTVPAGALALGFTFGIIEEALFLVGTPLIMRSITNTVAEFPNGEMAGDGLAAGWGALRGMNGGANGLRPATTEQVAKLQREVEKDRQYAYSQQGLFERYFDITESESLVTRLAFTAPATLNLNPKTLLSSATSLFNFGNVGKVASLIPGTRTAYATTAECDDPQIVEHNIAADMFCNPEMAHAPDLDIDETEQLLLAVGMINESGDPITPQNDPEDSTQPSGSMDYEDFVDLCLSGRPGLLYQPNTAGENAGQQTGGEEVLLDDCAIPGNTLPGDSYGRYERFAAYYGYKTDEQNLTDDANGISFASGSASGAPSANVGDLECPSTLGPTLQVGGSTYYQMPEAPDGEYTITGSITPPAQRYGQRELICVIYTASKAYKAVYGDQSTVAVSDLNASGHASHNGGVAVDLDAQGDVIAADNINNASRYSAEATIELGKAFVNTGYIKNIWWCGQGSSVGSYSSGDGTLEAIRAHAESIGKPVNIKCLSGHYNHFHIDINTPKGSFHEP